MPQQWLPKGTLQITAALLFLSREGTAAREWCIAALGAWEGVRRQPTRSRPRTQKPKYSTCLFRISRSAALYSSLSLYFTCPQKVNAAENLRLLATTSDSAHRQFATKLSDRSALHSISIRLRSGLLAPNRINPRWRRRGCPRLRRRRGTRTATRPRPRSRPPSPSRRRATAWATPTWSSPRPAQPRPPASPCGGRWGGAASGWRTAPARPPTPPATSGTTFGRLRTSPTRRWRGWLRGRRCTRRAGTTGCSTRRSAPCRGSSSARPTPATSPPPPAPSSARSTSPPRASPSAATRLSPTTAPPRSRLRPCTTRWCFP